MKTATPDFQAWLITARNMIIADCYLFTLMDGLALAWTDFDRNVTVSGALIGNGEYLSSGPLIKRSKISQTTGLEVATMDIGISAAPTHQITKISGSGMNPVLAEIASDRFAGAEVIVTRVYMDLALNIKGSVIQFAGSVADVEAKRLSASMTVKSKTEKLDHPIPKDLIQPGCRHVLYGPGCTLSEASWRTNGTVTGGGRFTVNTNLTPIGTSALPGAPVLSQSGSNPDTNQAPQTVYVVLTYTTVNGENPAGPEAFLSLTKNSLLRVASPAGGSGITGWNVYVGTASGDEQKQNQESIAIGTSWAEPADGIVQGTPPPLITTAGYYALGVITFTSGANKNIKRSILGNSSGTLNLKTGLPQAPAAGDTFYATPGCDKAKETCGSKFSNLIHFGGFPFIPQPESAL